MMTNYEMKQHMIRLGDEYIAQLWNTWCEEQHYYDDEIYSMDEFNEIMSGHSPLEIARLVAYGDFYANDDYFTFAGDGNIVTFDILTGKRISERCESRLCIDEMFDAIYRGDFLPAIYEYLAHGRETA